MADNHIEGESRGEGLDCFKSPAILEQHDHLHFKINSRHLDSATPIEEDEDTDKKKPRPASKSVLTLSSENPKKEKEIDLPYKEPPWSGVCQEDYFLEVLKNGCIVDKLNICQKPFYVFGRQLNCDFQLEHPSISRHHTVLQYRSIGDSWELGWYLCDLGSTHGTFVNREKIPPHMHLRLKVGYVLKFGGSTRMYILQGPDEDTERESTLTVTEIKQRAEKQKLALNLAKIKSKLPPETGDEVKTNNEEVLDENKNESEKDSGINWGITDDVDEGEEDEENADESEKIDFEEIEKREQLYIDDPRKALKNFFDREGVELKYEFFEKGGTFNKQWSCKVELPVETNQGKAVFAEVSVSGGKKEACAACALEACRMLDAYGVLRKSNQESKKRKEKHWEDNDYYDSDEDTFLDRTGDLERKREKRMRRSTDTPLVDNFDSLNNKLNVVEEEMKRVQRQLSLLQAEIRSKNRNEESGHDRDSLDNYMTEMSRHDAQEAKVQSSRLRLKMGELMKEADRLKKLIKISKPTALPALRSQFSTAKSADGKKPILTGSIKGRKLKMFIVPTPKVPSTDAPVVDLPISEPERRVEGTHEVESSFDHQKASQADKSINKSESSVSVAQIQEVQPPVIPKVDLSSSSDILKSYDTEKIVKKEAKSKVKSQKNLHEKLADYDPNDPDYAIWLPPENQTGDGKTSLNEKLGY